MTTPSHAAQYLQGRYRSYDERAVRYRFVATRLFAMGMRPTSSLLDIGGGDEEMYRCLREEFGWRGRYTNYDYATGHDIYDIFHYRPPLHEFAVSLETVEHLYKPFAHRLLSELPCLSARGVVITTPDADAQDVYAMDETHISPISYKDLVQLNYKVSRVTLYDGYYSEGKPDGLVAHCLPTW